jgi:hypothetical protein
MNKSGDKLVFADEGLTLDIPGNTMVPNAAYIFSLVVSKGHRKSEPLELTFSITGIEDMAIAVPPSPPAPNNGPVNVKVALTLPTDTKISSINFNMNLTPANRTPNPSLPFPSIIPPSTGGVFNIEIEITIGNQKTTIPFQLIVNAPPSPGKLVVTPARGTELTTDFTFSVSDVQDVDGPDLPITNNFGYYERNNNEKLFAVPTTSNSVTRQLSSNMRNLFNKVCDSANSCSYAKASVAVERDRRRELLSKDIPSLFDKLSLDEDSSFSICAMLAATLEFSESDWNYVYSRVVEIAKQFTSISDNQLIVEVNCFEALISMPAHQNTANLRRIISALLIIAAQYKDNSYEEVFKQQLNALQQYNLTTMEEVLLVDDYIDTIGNSFIKTNSPEQTGVPTGGNYATTLVQRVTSTSLTDKQYKNTQLNAIFPASTISHLSINQHDVLNLWLKMYRASSFPAGLVSVKLEISGILENYSWRDLETHSLISIVDLPEPANFTIPIYNPAAFTRGAQCVSFIDSKWSSTECTILNLNSSSVTVALKSVGFTTVVPIDINYVLSSPVPYMPKKDQECDRYYAPVFIMVSLVGAVLIAAAIGFCVGKVMKKTAQKEEEAGAESERVDRVELVQDSERSPSEVHISVPDERSQIGSDAGASIMRVEVPDERSQIGSDANSSIMRVEVPDERSQIGSDAGASIMRVEVPDERSHASIGIRDGKSDSSLAADVPPNSSHRSQPQPAEPDRPSSSPRTHSRPPKKVDEKEPVHVSITEFMAGHYLLGIFLCGRVINLLLLLTVLLSELFFLGVFYYFVADSHWDGTEISMGELFASYGREDVFYYIWSFIITFVLSLFLTTLFNPIWARTQKAKSLSMLIGAVLCVTLIILFIILIVLLNIAVCYEYAGRWSVGFLWAFITEVLIIEFVVAAYRWALLKFLRA